jgi:hypothetical protein
MKPSYFNWRGKSTAVTGLLTLTMHAVGLADNRDVEESQQTNQNNHSPSVSLAEQNTETPDFVSGVSSRKK